MKREERLSNSDVEIIHHPAGCGNPKIDKTIKLMLKNSDLCTGDTLLIDCGTGLMLKLAEQSAKSVTTFSSNFVEYACQKTNSETATHHFGNIPSIPLEQTFDTIFFKINKSQPWNRATISKALASLQKGGTLFIAGGNNEGIKSVEKRLKEAEIDVTVSATGGGGRIIAVEAGASLPFEFEPTATTYNFSPDAISVDTWPGLFSYEKVDSGSALLLENIPGITCKKVLDLGCGSGILTLGALAKGASEVTATDVSAMAIEATKANCNDERVTVVPSYIGDEVEGKFDIVLTNPPFHEGQKSNYSIGEAWLEDLRRIITKKTVVYLVANNFLPYFKFSSNYFEAVEIIKERDGFTLYKMWNCK